MLRLLPGLLLGLAPGLPMVPGAQARAEQPAVPASRIPLRSLGFPGYSVSLVHAGASMATVHLLDSSHALFTYSLRSLVPRIAGDDARDSDRQVAAVLVELPSGKVLGRTTWRLHDHARYLWSVGQGVFVVRIGNELSAMVPLHGLATGADPFRRYALPHHAGSPVLVSGSPDGRILTVEVAMEPEAGESDGAGIAEKRRHYALEFFRLDTPASADPAAPVNIAHAGIIGSPVLLQLAMDGDGYLWAEDGQRSRWTVSFNEFGGKQEKLAPVMSSCHPRLSLLSRGEFLVETCRGSDLSPMLAAYGFDGHENWEEHFPESLQPPTLALAPAAGRFALSRLTAVSTGMPSSTLGGDDPIQQEVRVYANESGDLLLHVQSAPAVRSAENFDLSPDGRTVALLGPETLDLYSLPPLSVKERQDLAEVAAMTPPVGNGPVALARITRPVAAPAPVSGGDVVRAADEAPAVPGSPARRPLPTPTEAAAERRADSQRSEGGTGTVPARGAATSAAGQDGALGDAAPSDARRRPPTLLEPGEKAETTAKQPKD